MRWKGSVGGKGCMLPGAGGQKVKIPVKGQKMNMLRVLLVALTLLPASLVQAQRNEYWGVTICNSGKVEFDVGYAERQVEAMGNYSWVIWGWKLVVPKKCEVVFEDNWWSNIFGKPGVHLAFVLTDSSGAFGYADFEVETADCAKRGSCLRSKIKICGRKEGMSYTRPRGDPASACDGKPGTFLVPAVFDIEPNYPDSWSSYTRERITTKIDVELDADYKAGELHASKGSESGNDQPPAEPGIGDAILKELGKELGKAAAEKRQKEEQAQAALPPGRFARFVDGCNAFYRDPANARFSSSHATAWCECLSEHYRNVMTPEEESRYANDFERLFRGGIAQPKSTDPAWQRLHPACVACAQ